jgi:hypothetical protein
MTNASTATSTPAPSHEESVTRMRLSSPWFVAAVALILLFFAQCVHTAKTIQSAGTNLNTSIQDGFLGNMRTSASIRRFPLSESEWHR